MIWVICQSRKGGQKACKLKEVNKLSTEATRKRVNSKGTWRNFFKEKKDTLDVSLTQEMAFLRTYQKKKRVQAPHKMSLTRITTN